MAKSKEEKEAIKAAKKATKAKKELEIGHSDGASIKKETEEETPVVEEETPVVEEETPVVEEETPAEKIRSGIRKKETLKIGDHVLTSVEDDKCRGAVELFLHTKGKKFRGHTLTQEKLDILMSDGDFLKKLGYLRQHVKPRK